MSPLKGKKKMEKPILNKELSTLTKVLDSFEPFDDEMRLETVARRQKDDAKIAAMKAELARLAGLLEEARRDQSEEDATLRARSQVDLQRAQETFSSLMDHQVAKVHERLKAIEVKADALELKFYDDKARIHMEIDDRSSKLSTLLDEFHAAFEKELESRRDREAKIVSAMDDHDKVVEDKFNQEAQIKETNLNDIQQELALLVSSRTHGNQQLQKVCFNELDKIQTALDAEIQHRQHMDAKILSSMEQYTQKLQRSLRNTIHPHDIDDSSPQPQDDA